MGWGGLSVVFRCVLRAFVGFMVLCFKLHVGVIWGFWGFGNLCCFAEFGFGVVLQS